MKTYYMTVKFTLLSINNNELQNQSV